MPRSTYVYIVVDDGIPIAAFTVKYELGIWLAARQPVDDYRIWRINDGLYSLGENKRVLLSRKDWP